MVNSKNIVDKILVGYKLKTINVDKIANIKKKGDKLKED